jgi:hypothetical protein
MDPGVMITLFSVNGASSVAYISAKRLRSSIVPSDGAYDSGSSVSMGLRLLSERSRRLSIDRAYGAEPALR